MHRSRALLVASFLALLTGAAAAPAADAPVKPGGAQRVITPVFHRLVAFTLPPPFKLAYERTTGNIYVREHVPENETVDEWSRMITLSGVQGMAYSPAATPQAYLQALARGFQRHCPDTYVALDLGPQPLTREPSFATVASCGRVSLGRQGTQRDLGHGGDQGAGRLLRAAVDRARAGFLAPARARRQVLERASRAARAGAAVSDRAWRGAAVRELRRQMSRGSEAQECARRREHRDRARREAPSGRTGTCAQGLRAAGQRSAMSDASLI